MKGNENWNFSNLEIGDDVICSFSKDGTYYKNEIGKIRYMEIPRLICIEFENHIGGHSGGSQANRYMGKPGHCWNFYIYDSYKLTLRKVGDEEDKGVTRWWRVGGKLVKESLEIEYKCKQCGWNGVLEVLELPSIVQCPSCGTKNDVWLDGTPIPPRHKKFNKNEAHVYKLYEKLGISDAVHSSARKIYKKYNLEKLKFTDRSKLKKEIQIDTSELDEPFNKMKISLRFIFKEGKNLRGGVDRIGPDEFNLYIYHQCKNIGRTLAHELTHIHQIYLRGRHFKTNKENEPILRQSEQSPSLMSAYVRLRQKKVKTQKEFLDEIKKLPKYKRCKEIINNPGSSKKDKDIASNFIKKVDKMYPLFVNENSSENVDIKINVENKNYLIDNLIEKLSLIVKKRKTKMG
jgi:DNA-directed RNA polymerase subunit RPC12/RpoP